MRSILNADGFYNFSAYDVLHEDILFGREDVIEFVSIYELKSW